MAAKLTKRERETVEAVAELLADICTPEMLWPVLDKLSEVEPDPRFDDHDSLIAVLLADQIELLRHDATPEGREIIEGGAAARGYAFAADGSRRRVSIPRD